MKDSSWRPCGYGCGKPWRPFAGTTLIGHAACAITFDEQDALLARLEAEPRLTYRAIASERGVNVSIVTAWVQLALRRRAKRREDAARAARVP